MATDWTTRGPLGVKLGRDGAGLFVVLIIACMAYLATLAVAATAIVSGQIRAWQADLGAGMTIVLPSVGQPTADETRANTAVALLNRQPGVAAAAVIDQGTSDALVQPWLGDDLADLGLALPTLIDVQRVAGVDLDVAALGRALAEIVPGAVVEDHAGQFGDLIDLGVAARWLALSGLVLIAAAAVATIASVTRAGLSAHRKVVDLLHALGATDGYIAAQFQRYALVRSSIGGAIGTVLAMATLAALGYSLAAGPTAFLPDLRLGAQGWSALMLVPVAAAVLSMGSARLTAMRFLAALP